MSCNYQVFSYLSSKCILRYFLSILPSCETCLTALRNMPDRASKHTQPRCETCLYATRNMPNRNRMVRFWGFNLVKTAVSFSISRKILTQHFDQNIRQSLFLYHPIMGVASIKPQSALDRNWCVVRTLWILFNPCQRFFRHLASSRVST